MHWTVVSFLFCFAGFVSSDPISPPIPVQDTEPGTRYEPIEPQPRIRWEVFIDLNSQEGAEAWPEVKHVHFHYGEHGPEEIDLVFHHITVPYNRNSLISTQGFFVIENWNFRLVFDYVDAVLENYEQFSTDATANKTETEVIGELADVAVASTGIDRDLFISEIGNHRTYAIGLYKYASKRGVAAPSTYFVNGVDVVVGENYAPTHDDWVAFFDELIASA